MPRDAEQLPADFLARLAVLERAYLRESDPIRQSGFAGGAARWRAEREPILDAVDDDGDLLDVGCANGSSSAPTAAAPVGKRRSTSRDELRLSAFRPPASRPAAIRC